MAYFETWQINEAELRSVYFHVSHTHYELPDGSLLSVHQDSGWCYECQDVVAVEKLQSLKEIAKWIQQLEDGISPIIQVLSSHGIEILKEELPRRREWRIARTSAARCLNCGATDFFRLADDSQIKSKVCWTEPVNGLRFMQTARGHASMGSETAKRLTAEGVINAIG